MLRPVRKATTLDAMILVGFAAVGLAVTRVSRHFVPGASPGFARMITVALLALTLTISLIPLRLRPPRPRLAFRLPGLIACCAVALALLFILAEQAYQSFMLNPSSAGLLPGRRAVDLFVNIIRFDLYSFTVAGAWMALALSGRWRPEPDWLDRTGCVLGVCWIVSPFVATVAL
jgi:hypothetical protein